MSSAILKIRNLTKKYNERVVVNNLTLDVFEGEIFGFLGANGAGKSTTMKMITGLASITSGDVFICNNSIKTNFEKAIINVGGFIEIPEMYKNFSGLDNLMYYASLYDNISKERINSIVELVGLKDRIKDKVKTYSLGMKQRLGIAQALLHSPKLLVLDEPTNGLDPEAVIELRRFLKKIAIKEKIAIFISSHNLPEMELICDTIGIINNGILEQIRSIDQLKQILLEKYKNLSISIKKNTLNIQLDTSLIPEITQLLVQNGILIYSISSSNKSLEDIFLDTINRRSLPAPKGAKNG